MKRTALFVEDSFDSFAEGIVSTKICLSFAHREHTKHEYTFLVLFVRASLTFKEFSFCCCDRIVSQHY